MHEVWVKCPVCKIICRVFLIRLTSISFILVNPHEHSVARGVGGRSVVLLTEMRMVRNPYIGRIYGPQIPIMDLKKALEVEELDRRMDLNIERILYIVEGRSKHSEDIIAGFETYGEVFLEWLPKMVWIKYLYGANWSLLQETYVQLICKREAALIPLKEADQKSDYHNRND